MDTDVKFHELIKKTLKQPDKTGTVQIPNPIKYEFFIRHLATTTNDFSTVLNTRNGWKYGLIKNAELKSINVEINYKAQLISTKGNLELKAQIIFYLRDDIKKPNPAYLNKLSAAAYTILTSEFYGLNHSSVQINIIKIVPYSEYTNRVKWGKAVDAFMKKYNYE